MNAEFKTGDTIHFNHKGKRCKGVVRGVQLALDSLGRGYIIVKRGRHVIPVAPCAVILDEVVR